MRTTTQRSHTHTHTHHPDIHPGFLSWFARSWSCQPHPLTDTIDTIRVQPFLDAHTTLDHFRDKSILRMDHELPEVRSWGLGKIKICLCYCTSQNFKELLDWACYNVDYCQIHHTLCVNPSSICSACFYRFCPFPFLVFLCCSCVS